MKQDETFGAIFDWDGVVVDSSSHHEESWERLAKETGLTLPDGHFKKGSSSSPCPYTKPELRKHNVFSVYFVRTDERCH
jgi:beta-phosphoglucomutase-like phosphatase (HAD superfamily)